MDRIPKTGSSYGRDNNRTKTPAGGHSQAHIMGHSVSKVEKRHMVFLRKIRRARDYLRKLRQKKITRHTALNDLSCIDDSASTMRSLHSGNEQDHPDYHEGVDYENPQLKKKHKRSKGDSTLLTSQHKHDVQNDNTLMQALPVATQATSLIGQFSEKKQPTFTPVDTLHRLSPETQLSLDIFAEAEQIEKKVHDVAGVVSAFRQAYDSEKNIKKIHSHALDKLDSLTVDDILQARPKGISNNKPITKEEVIAYIYKAMMKKTKVMTLTAGMTGTLTLVSFIGAGALFFLPLLPVALGGLGVGIIVSLIFNKINQEKVKRRLDSLFFQIAKSTLLANVNEAMTDKIATLNKERSAISRLSLPDHQPANHRGRVGNSLFLLENLSYIMGAGAKLVSVLSYVASGVKAVVNFFSALYFSVLNYRDRQKGLKQLDRMVVVSMTPEIMRRSFPYIKPSPFNQYVIENRASFARSLGFNKTPSKRVLLRQLSKPGCYKIKRQLQNRCIRHLLKKRFCRYLGINIKLLESMNRDDFEKKYGLAFQRFATKSVTNYAFKDTLKAGVNGSLACAAGFFSLAFIPGTAVVLLPIALAVMPVGVLVSVLVAYFEKAKFSRRMNSALLLDKESQAVHAVLKLKKFMLREPVISG